MFARVITAEAGTEELSSFIRLARRQLPGARQMPGFKGYYVLTDPGTGKLMVISLWETWEHMEAVGGSHTVQDQDLPATGLTPPHLDTYEVTMHG